MGMFDLDEDIIPLIQSPMGKGKYYCLVMLKFDAGDSIIPLCM